MITRTKLNKHVLKDYNKIQHSNNIKFTMFRIKKKKSLHMYKEEEI